MSSVVFPARARYYHEYCKKHKKKQCQQQQCIVKKRKNVNTLWYHGMSPAWQDVRREGVLFGYRGLDRFKMHRVSYTRSRWSIASWWCTVWSSQYNPVNRLGNRRRDRLGRPFNNQEPGCWQMSPRADIAAAVSSYWYSWLPTIVPLHKEFWSLICGEEHVSVMKLITSKIVETSNWRNAGNAGAVISTLRSR